MDEQRMRDIQTAYTAIGASLREEPADVEITEGVADALADMVAVLLGIMAEQTRGSPEAILDDLVLRMTRREMGESP